MQQCKNHLCEHVDSSHKKYSRDPRAMWDPSRPRDGLWLQQWSLVLIFELCGLADVSFGIGRDGRFGKYM